MPAIGYLVGKDVVPYNAPHYPGLSKTHLWGIIDRTEGIPAYFPDGDDRDRISRNWIVDVSSSTKAPDR